MRYKFEFTTVRIVRSRSFPFFMVAFIGDSQVSIDFRESDELMRVWSDLNRSVYEDWLKHQQVFIRSQ